MNGSTNALSKSATKLHIAWRSEASSDRKNRFLFNVGEHLEEN